MYAVIYCSHEQQQWSEVIKKKKKKKISELLYRGAKVLGNLKETIRAAKTFFRQV